jgi:ABC-type enterochelin transport system substrate-binding protein
MQKTIDDLKTKSKAEIERLQLENQDLKEGTRSNHEEIGQSLREKEDELKALRNMFDKEMAIFKQKIEFKDVQN